GRRHHDRPGPGAGGGRRTRTRRSGGLAWSPPGVVDPSLTGDVVASEQTANDPPRGAVGEVPRLGERVPEPVGDRIAALASPSVLPAVTFRNSPWCERFAHQLLVFTAR